MKNKYPFIIKNFSNYDSYYPRIFYKPYNKFFDNKYFNISHSYFNNEKYNKTNKEKIMHFEYGHGLLNQTNLDLYTISNKDEPKDENINNNDKKNKGNNEISNSDNCDTIFEKIENNMTPLTDGTFARKKDFLKHQNKSNISFERKLSINQTVVITKFECEKISHKYISNGFLFFGFNFLIFKVNTKFDRKEYKKNPVYLLSCSEYDLVQEEKQTIIPYNLINQIIYRKFLFYNIAIELFLKNGKSYYFNFYNKSNKTQFINSLREKIPEDIIIVNSTEYFEKKKYMNKWLEGVISTVDYLLLINKYSDRSYNVLSQYIILPYLLNTYDNIYNSESFRNFNFPVRFKSKEELDQVFQDDGNDEYKNHFSNYCSNYMYVNHYLFRSYPYINNQIRLQDNYLDDPGRQFSSLMKTFEVFRENPKINLELVPEFYFNPEFFLNLNCCFYGKVSKKDDHYLVNNLGIGPDFHHILEIINYHQTNLNSENAISHINKWIDYIFGENQISNKNDDVYFFPKECYETFVKEDIEEQCKEMATMNLLKKKADFEGENSKEIDSIKQNLAQEITKYGKKIKTMLYKSNYYGHCPSQIFTKNHPAFTKKIETKIYNFSNINNYHLILKNERIIIDKKDNILYIQESSKGNYFYAVSEHEILVFHKTIKLSNSLSINYIPNIPKIFSVKYFKNENYFKLLFSYKYLIFDLFDCKYFFIGGYMDNSLRIYTKEKEKDKIYSIYVESQIRSMKHSLNNQTIFTGHENGKIIKWKYQINNDNNQIDITKEISIRGHESPVKMVEINEKYECIISVDDDEIILIRKIYDFELLSCIKLNKYKKKVIDINIYNQIIMLTIFKIKLNKIFIYTYSLNGLNLGKIAEPLILPITIIPNTDEIILFRTTQIYLSKVALNAKTSFVAITNNLDIPDIDLSSEDDDIAFNFNKDLHISEAISYFYDGKNRVLFCLFSNGTLYRINFVKNI